MYGYTPEEKARKASYEKKEYENLPWSLPIQQWEGYQLSILSRHSTQAGIQKLSDVENTIENE